MRQRYAIEDAEHPIYQRKPTMTATQPQKSWELRKEKVLARINTERSVFINPSKNALDWQAGLQLVGKGLVSYDGATFRAL